MTVKTLSLLELEDKAVTLLHNLIERFPEYKAQLDTVYFKWTARMDRTAGTASLSGLVKLSKPIFTVPENQHDFEDTILHEIAHVICGRGRGHSKRWKKIATTIGCSGERCHSLKTRPTRRVSRAYVFCTKCDAIIEVSKTFQTRVANGTTKRVWHKCGGKVTV